MPQTTSPAQPAATIAIETDEDVAAVIEMVYSETLTPDSCDGLEALLRKLVEPGQAERYRAAVLEALEA